MSARQLEGAGDRAAIARFLAERGPTQCAPSAAAVMGEWRPGPWREAERRAERRGGKAFDKQQRLLRHRYPTAEADHPRFVVVTRALVDAGASGTDAKGDPVGWTNRQVAILDPESKRKPVKGWRYRSDGRQIPWSSALAFLTSAKRKKLRPKPGSTAEAEAIETLERLAAGQTTARGSARCKPWEIPQLPPRRSKPESQLRSSRTCSRCSWAMTPLARSAAARG